MKLIPLPSRQIKACEPLIPYILDALKKKGLRCSNGDILAITSKVVAVSQGRLILQSQIDKVVKKESKKIFTGPHKNSMPLSLRDGVFIPAAGIDKSNAPKGMAILWPEKPNLFAQTLHKQLKRKFKIQKFGIIITDSHCHPLRTGTIGITLGVAGFEPVYDMRGKPDMYWKKLKVSQLGIADSLATAANLIMGEGRERIPFALIQDVPKQVKFTNKPQRIPTIKPNKCIFAGIYNPSVLTGKRKR